MSARPVGSFSRLLSPIVNPGVFDFWVKQVNPAWSWERPLASVAARQLEAKDTVTLTLKLNRHCDLPLPGQHVNVSAEVNGRRVTRSYSPTQINRAKGTLSITVKLVPGGVLSDHLCHHAQVGDVVEIASPFGDLTWPEHAQGRWLLLAAGSGITPMISLIRNALTSGKPIDLSLIYWASTRAEMCFVPELRALAVKHPRFHVHFVLTREPELLSEETSGRLDGALLAALITDWSERQIYACGPAGFVDTARELTAQKARHFKAESFTPPAPVHTDTAGKLVKVTLQASGRTLDVASGQSLLTALEAHGLNPAAGCRMGICRTCVCPKPSGTSQNMQTGERDSEPDSALRLCMSTACSDITLDL